MNRLVRARVTGTNDIVWVPTDAECGNIRSWYAGLSDTQKRALVKPNKPAPPDNQTWQVDDSCILDGPVWYIGGNGGNSLSIYVKAASGLTRKTRVTAQNQVPAATPVTITMENKPGGYSREGKFVGTYPYASLHTGLSAGNSYLVEQLDASSNVTESKIVILTVNGPELALLAGGGGNVAPVVASPVPDYTTTLGTSFDAILPTNLFTDIDGTIASIAVSGLPPGLAFSTSLKRITGNTTQVGTYLVTVTGTDNGGLSVSDLFTITVVASSGGASFVDGGASETYSGSLVSEPGMPTRPDRLNLGLIGWDGIKGKPTNLANFTPSSGKRLIFSIGLDTGWLEKSVFEDIYLYGGATYTVVMLEIDSSNTNFYTYIASDPNRSVQTFSIH